MTQQAADSITIEGRRFFLQWSPGLPQDDPRIIKLNMSEIDGIFGSTACYRGYIANWEIEKGKLFLRSVEGIFELKEWGSIIYADWFTGKLAIGLFHYGFECRDVRAVTVYDVKDGRIIDGYSEILDNEYLL
jgi:hypothetical protein